MLKTPILFFSFLFTFWVYSQQTPGFGETNSHEFYVSQLTNSKDENFQEIIKLYEAHIHRNPNDVAAQVELCKFIGNSYWDEYEEYNLKYEETEECISNLAAKHPKNPKVLIYRAENLYGEDKLEVLNSAKGLIETNRTEWLSLEVAEINRMLGDYHQEKKWLSLMHYKKAQKLNDSLDLSLSIAKIYEAQGKKDLAKEVLLPNLEKDTTLWKMNQKANLLLKLNEPQKALDLFDVIGKRDSTFIDNEEMAKAMADLGDFATAREFLVRDTIKEWNKINAKQLLFAHDLAQSEGKVALESYRKLQEESSYDDFFGVKRFRVFLKNPLLRWSPSEVFHLFLLYGLILVAFALPYLWVMPVYGLGSLLRKSGISIRPKLNSQWNIKHFWLVSFFYLLASVLTVIIFEYQDTLNYYFDLGNTYFEESTDKSLLANEMILFVALMAISTLLVLGGKKIKFVFKSNLSIRQMIGLGILFVVFNRIFIKILSLFVDLEDTVGSNIILNAKEEILAVMAQNGFLVTVLLVAVIVPIYEEVVFRGVILGSVERYVGFKGANVIQAILFALVHDDLALFPFFFVFALVTGYWVKKSKGLLTGIFFHGIHNFTILVALYYLSKMTSVFGESF
ncbi:CPBP family intramembrane metalloprotease [Maribacter algarum]|uniref:CPBP family intramembrane metalloprotease n=1 Tax=Maribacter algarum (ex Zhang et al. 2020) TaxID=2578118 RepID=A0A5S3PW67_9FLAO|nr:type II CAAX endopeptidase family protein [Maribacter algarum]TMM57238.1 CPBP family intramembrane metalloprotease [Maribacter algarum]